MTSKKHRRSRLLLDEGLPPKEAFPNTNNLHNVAHIVHDIKATSSPDRIVYSIAQKQSRLPAVFNIKDFKPMIRAKTPSVIVLSANLTNQTADVKICKVLRKLKPSELKGHLVQISYQGIVIKRLI